MNYLLYGADTYRSRKKLNEIIAEYRLKNGGDVNFHRFDAEEDDPAALRASAGTGSLFAAKKLVVVERALAAPRDFESICTLLAENRGKADTLLVVWDAALEGEEAEKRLAEVAEFFDKKQEFPQLSGTALGRWIREQAVSAGLSLSPSEIEALAVSTRGDLWRVHNELEKMALGGGVAAGSGRESVIFDLGDTFFSAPRQALRHLFSLLAHGEEEGRIFSYLSNHARTLLMVKSHLAGGRPIPAGAKIHPYVIKKASAQVRMLQLRDLVQNLSHFLQEDLRIKTGVARANDSLLRLLLG